MAPNTKLVTCSHIHLHMRSQVSVPCIESTRQRTHSRTYAKSKLPFSGTIMGVSFLKNSQTKPSTRSRKTRC